MDAMVLIALIFVFLQWVVLFHSVVAPLLSAGLMLAPRTRRKWGEYMMAFKTVPVGVFVFCLCAFVLPCTIFFFCNDAFLWLGEIVLIGAIFGIPLGIWTTRAMVKWFKRRFHLAVDYRIRPFVTALLALIGGSVLMVSLVMLGCAGCAYWRIKSNGESREKAWEMVELPTLADGVTMRFKARDDFGSGEREILYRLEMRQDDRQAVFQFYIPQSTLNRFKFYRLNGGWLYMKGYGGEYLIETKELLLFHYFPGDKLMVPLPQYMNVAYRPFVPKEGEDDGEYTFEGYGSAWEECAPRLLPMPVPEEIWEQPELLGNIEVATVMRSLKWLKWEPTTEKQP